MSTYPPPKEWRINFTKVVKQAQSVCPPETEKLRATQYTEHNLPMKLAQWLPYPAYRHSHGIVLCEKGHLRTTGFCAHGSLKVML